MTLFLKNDDGQEMLDTPMVIRAIETALQQLPMIQKK
jgi:hypothetical protein